jgi:acyl-CoA thioester hydrolase
MLEEFRYVRRFPVTFADVDMLRHVNHIAYVRWAEDVRCAYFAEILAEDITGERGLIMAKLEVVYEKPIAYREAVAVGCRVSRMGRKSFDFSYEIWSETRGERCAHLHSPMVAFNYATGASIVIPEAWRERVGAFETTPVAVA